MLWILLTILAFGGALAIATDVFGGNRDHSHAIAAVTWSCAVLLYLARAWISPTAVRSAAIHLAVWLAIAAFLGVAWVLYFSRS